MHDTILTFVKDRFRPSGGNIDSNTPLFSGGIIDSFGLLELIVFLENTFAVTIDPGAHEMEEFDTVDKIVTLISRLQGCGAVS